MKGVAVLVVGLVLGVGVASPPIPQIELRPGEEAVTDQLTRELFDRDVRWVPGDVRTARLLIRNGGATSALVWLGLPSDDEHELLSDGHVTVLARLDEGPWVRVRHGEHHHVLTQERLDAGAAATLTVQVEFSQTADHRTHHKRADLPLMVTMTGDRVAPSRSGDLLPRTGSLTTPLLLVIAVASCAVGLWWRRRQREEGR